MSEDATLLRGVLPRVVRSRWLAIIDWTLRTDAGLRPSTLAIATCFAKSATVILLSVR